MSALKRIRDLAHWHHDDTVEMLRSRLACIAAICAEKVEQQVATVPPRERAAPDCTCPTYPNGMRRDDSATCALHGQS